MGKFGNALQLYRESKINQGLIVNSIDSIKGLEGNKCLFILTTDLAEYLFKQKNDQNKMLNYLYVALTRSKKELIFLVSIEVEAKYGRDFINEKFGILNVIALQTTTISKRP